MSMSGEYNTPFTLHIYAADRVFYDGECESVSLPTTHGQYCILAHHSNLIAAIIPGKMTFRKADGQTVAAAVSEGLVKVESGEVLVLVDSAELPEEIDANRARREAEEAKEEMLQKRSIVENTIARGNLARAINRIRVKNSGR